MSASDTMPLSAGEIATLRTLLDRQAIQDCLSRIARGSDRFDRALALSGFHPGAVVSMGGDVIPAEDSYARGRAMHEQATAATLHCLSTSNVEIDGETAHGETYHIYAARALDGTNWAAAGRYLDRFERREGAWGVVFRHIVIDWAGKAEPHMLALFQGGDAPRTPLSPSRDRDDVSYLRPLVA